jgi:glycosyltransferase involved in cell wall biosynthesis
LTAASSARAASLLFLTRYTRAGASSRYRFYQYIPALEEAGFNVTVAPLFDDAYLADQYRGRGRRLLHYARALRSRVAAIQELGRFDLAVIEKELIPYSPALAESRLLRGRYVVDYDDAIFHQYDDHPNPLVRRLLADKIAKVMRHARLVIAGNAYLGGYARRAGAPRVELLPTVVDLERFGAPRARRRGGRPFTIGWIGSPHTARYLEPLAPALARVCAGGRGRVVLIGAGELRLADVPVEVLPWSEATEVRDIRGFDVGIMPLKDTPWERGKCGFKLIQYMGCGLPVVASPVGVNTEIVDVSSGILATSEEDWVHALEALRDDPELRNRLGAVGRAKVEAHYCLRVAAPRMVSLLRSSLTTTYDADGSADSAGADLSDTAGHQG